MPPEEMLPPAVLVMLVSVIGCPQTLCGTEFEGIWLAADEPGGTPDGTLQVCPACGHHWDAEYPGHSFTVEA